MLQKQSFQEQGPNEDVGQLLSPEYLIDVLKRRILYFAIPFVLVLIVGSAVTVLWPARYLSEGKILVESQQIPSELVRPTVSTAANERIQVIEQRIMTRDNLLAIAKKFNMFAGQQLRISGTDVLDFIRDRTSIKPLELRLPSRNPNSQAIAFKVGFEHEEPQIAMKVANEFVTMILKEDVRTRTSFASETTKFLEQEVKRLEGELGSVDAKLSQLRAKQSTPAIQAAQSRIMQLAALKAELLVRAASYSESHPDMKMLKQRIAVLEKTIGDVKAEVSGLEALETQKKATQDNLVKTNEKLAAARLGESLERGQHSERLEVIEQPTLPQKPVSPNRGKMFVLVLAIAGMAGGGLVFVLEALDRTIHRKADILPIVDSHMVVSIPYISTHEEVYRRKRTIMFAAGMSALILMVGLTIVFFLLPPPEVLLEKALAVLRR